jgi:hypothetical protein
MANGGEMGRHGEKDVTFTDAVNGDAVGLKFQATDVRKPLLAVRRLVETGKMVQFGPDPEQNYISHAESGRKITLGKKSGSFASKANFLRKVGAATSGFTRQAS